jgi:hypothetical protein
VLSNSGAHLSRINLRSPSEESDDEDGYEIVNGGGSVGVRDNEERNNPGTLSGKAGIILVRIHLLSPHPCAMNLRTDVDVIFEIGHSQHFHRHTPVPRHRFLCHPLRIAGPENTFLAST